MLAPTPASLAVRLYPPRRRRFRLQLRASTNTVGVICSLPRQQDCPRRLLDRPARSQPLPARVPGSCWQLP